MGVPGTDLAVDASEGVIDHANDMRWVVVNLSGLAHSERLSDSRESGKYLVTFISKWSRPGLGGGGSRSPHLIPTSRWRSHTPQ